MAAGAGGNPLTHLDARRIALIHGAGCKVTTIHNIEKMFIGFAGENMIFHEQQQLMWKHQGSCSIKPVGGLGR